MANTSEANHLATLCSNAVNMSSDSGTSTGSKALIFVSACWQPLKEPFLHVKDALIV